MLNHLYLNGEYIAREDAKLHTSDLSILRGYGVFDYFRYAARSPRFMEDHLSRFERSSAALGLPIPLSRKELAEVIQELIERNDRKDGGIRLVLTGGYAEDGYTPHSPNLLALPYGFTPPPENKYRDGCSVMLHNYTRQLPAAKTIDYITRKHLIALAANLGIRVQERAVSVEDVLSADEAIICSSIKGAMPITRIDGQPVGGGAAGAVTLRLMEAWREYTK